VASPNVDLVRSIYADWERGDFSSVEWAHAEIEYVMADGPSPGSRTGLTGMAAGWREWLSAWEGYRTEAEGYRELDGERVLVLAGNTGRGKTSGVEIGHVQPRGAAVFRIRDGKVTRLVVYWSRDHALADLGLAPEGDRS
jgi:ketosteroid isomerase-like protein